MDTDEAVLAELVAGEKALAPAKRATKATPVFMVNKNVIVHLAGTEI
jgi:hypothetical protein